MKLANLWVIGALFGIAVSAQQSQGTLEKKTKSELKNKLQEDLSKTIGSLQFTLGLSGPLVTNQPYFAEATTETIQTLANEIHIRQTRSYAIYRDSEGRQRRETRTPAGAVEKVIITDPAANVSYLLEPATMTAHKMAIGIATASAKEGHIAVAVGGAAYLKEDRTKAHAGQESGGRDRDVVTKSLGSRIIEGISAEGTRITRTIPIGVIGNDQPIEVVNESWYSHELQTVVMSRRNDPRTGEAVYQLKNIDRSEPDPALFQVSGNFKIVSQK